MTPENKHELPEDTVPDLRGDIAILQFNLRSECTRMVQCWNCRQGLKEGAKHPVRNFKIMRRHFPLVYAEANHAFAIGVGQETMRYWWHAVTGIWFHDRSLRKFLLKEVGRGRLELQVMPCNYKAFTTTLAKDQKSRAKTWPCR